MIYVQPYVLASNVNLQTKCILGALGIPPHGLANAVQHTNGPIIGRKFSMQIDGKISDLQQNPLMILVVMGDPDQLLPD